MPSAGTFNTGSTLFQPFADVLGLPVDKINFVFCLFISLPISLLYRQHCAPEKVSRNVRLAVPLIIGVILGCFLYGTGFKHVIGTVVGSYILAHVTPIDHIHRSTFLFSLGYITWIHAYRVLFVTEYAIDITGPIMIIVQKTTTLAFSLHDGLVKVPRKERLTVTQAREAQLCVPSPLEYFSYMLSYMTLFCGPLCFYADYIAFIDGLDRPVSVWKRLRRESDALQSVSDAEADDESEYDVDKARRLPPVPQGIVMKKAREAIAAMMLHIAFAPFMPHTVVLTGTVGQMSILIWFPYLIVALFFVRCQYYFAWIFADAVNNAAGFGYDAQLVVDEKKKSGFSEYDADCEKWSLVRNVRPLEFELSDSWKTMVDAWNISTLRWLRRVAYERLHVRLRTPATYFLSAWWHGFFPGYYIMFGTAALATSAARRVRRCLRHHFLSSPNKKFFYDCITFLAVKIFITYSAYPFALMFYEPGIAFYKKTYFLGHVAMLIAVAILPRIMRPLRGQEQADKAAAISEAKAKANGSLANETNGLQAEEMTTAPVMAPEIDTVSLSASSVYTASPQRTGRYADDDHIPVANIPPIVERALKELPSADPLVSPRSKGRLKRE